MGDTFTSTLFKQTFQKLFTKDSQNAHFRMSFNASFEIKVMCGICYALPCYLQGGLQREIRNGVISYHLMENFGMLADAVRNKLGFQCT